MLYMEESNHEQVRLQGLAVIDHVKDILTINWPFALQSRFDRSGQTHVSSKDDTFRGPRDLMMSRHCCIDRYIIVIHKQYKHSNM